MLPATALVCALALSACGGDSDAGDEGESTGDGAQERIVEVITTNQTEAGDPTVECEETVTERFADQLYGSVEDCRARVTETGDQQQPADEVEVGEVEVDAGEATAQVDLSGGDLDGVSGQLALVETDGGWLIDDVGGDFAAAAVEAFIVRDATRQSATTADVECLLSVLGPALRSQTESKDLLFGINRGDRDALNVLTGAGRLCTPVQRERAGSRARNEFEEQLAAQLTGAGEVSERRVGCVLGVLRENLSETQVQAWLRDREADRPEPQATRRQIEDAQDLCANVP